MARSGRFTHSVILGFAGQMVTMAAGLWLSPFLLHRLGVAGYGFWIVGQQALVYLTLMDVGVVALLPRETAYANGRDDAAVELPRLVARTMRIVLLQTPVVGGIAALIWWLIPRGWGDVRALAGLAVIAFSLLFPLRIFRGVLEGLQDLAFISWSYMSGWFAGLIVSVGLVVAGYGLKALAAGWAATQAVDATLCLFRLHSRFHRAVPKRWIGGDVGSGLRRQLLRGVWMSVSQVAQVLIYGTDAAIVGRLFGAAAVVPYNCTGKLIAVLANQPQNIMRAAEPGLSEMRVSEPRERLEGVTSALSLAMLLASGLVTTVALTVNAGFVRWWMGGQFYGGLPLTALFATSMLLRHLNITAIYTLFAFRHERSLAIASLADGILSTIFSVVLAWILHSPVGVLLGSILSTSCVLVFGNARLLARELGIPMVELARPLTGWFWRMLLAGWFACMVRQSSTAGMVCGGIVAVFAYAALMVPVAMRSELRPYLDQYLSPRKSAVTTAAGAACAG